VSDYSDRDYLNCFAMPSGTTITGRSSSIRNVFVAAIVPLVKPSSAEIRDVLAILEMTPNDLRCSYCGDQATEWDHLRPLVTDGRPTGFPSSIRNLVPSCGKCNQSKGKRDWREWMTCSAPRSPQSRRIADLAHRIQRLEAYEQWAACSPIKISDRVPVELLNDYYSLQNEILLKMKRAQEMAATISAHLAKR
jgi:5-methylcytosine-specific restriction endonuclease McrA